MIWYAACDGNGTDSIDHVIAKNKDKIIVREIDHYSQFESMINENISKIKPGDTFIVDTLSALANTARTDRVLKEDLTADYTKLGEKYYGDKEAMTVYKATTQTLIRRIKDVKSLGANIIVLCHETEKEVDYGEGVEKRRAPDLNEALLALVYSSSSDIARLRVLTEAKTNKDGVVVMPKGARVLDFSINDDFMAKWHIDLDNAVSGKIPTLISRPSYPKVCKALNKTPTWLTTYGRPGAGKTTFSISQLIDPEGIGIGL